MAESKVRSRAGTGPARAVVLVLALVYLVLAVGGVVTVGWGSFGWEDPVTLFGVFGISTLANILHGFIGVVALVAALRGGAYAFAPVAGIAFTAMSAFGIAAKVFRDEGDPLNLTWWNVALYLCSLVACVVVYGLRVRLSRRTADRHG
ncbi:DUF4383 domain-containing protein [Actinophytocola gossypii]|nr:DUF4383 domain-containing protein [Actinophytocola gossypii]